MHLINKVLIPLLFIVLIHTQGLAQAGYSPYSSKGVGDLVGVGLTHNRGMGGLGISNGSPMFYNNTNPALLYRNSLSVFAIGMTGEYKQISTSELSQKNYTGGFNYALLGLPIMVDKWTLGLGIMPYSVVNYKYNTIGSVLGNPEATVTKTFEGSGGFNKVFLSNGVKINKNFSVGLTVGYLFGSIKDEVTTVVKSPRVIERDLSDGGDTTIFALSNQALLTQRFTMGDVYIMGGAAYRIPLKKQTFLNLGVTYELGGQKDTRLYENLRNSNFNENTNFANDTLKEAKGSIKLPSSFGIGITYEKTYHWTVGADIVMRNWSDYQGFGETDENFENNITFSVGGEYIPDIASVDNYLKRMIYRLGLTYQKLPYQINQQTINDFGINFGVSLPVRSFSSFDLAFQLGQRGTTSNDLIKEKYVQVHLGVTFNDKWFVRRKYD